MTVLLSLGSLPVVDITTLGILVNDIEFWELFSIISVDWLYRNLFLIDVLTIFTPVALNIQINDFFIIIILNI